eukprot:CAMPEP_0203940624 /NCGR_PEP_ID=MMETSP0359-20131031/77170_1 /ASSEMBLY_ACC=CAM_ASM_000338 /TAXON_ID=268821 /ORGANISM="Scrippsiella Hangoei, Strain SHTV-5" /LENGTH=67 /DNA_ID=CAMNT_0050871079 /DNA_START=102 /DNA_END=301 /DNA_ORIENTATION=-
MQSNAPWNSLPASVPAHGGANGICDKYSKVWERARTKRGSEVKTGSTLATASVGVAMINPCDRGQGG